MSSQQLYQKTIHRFLYQFYPFYKENSDDNNNNENNNLITRNFDKKLNEFKNIKNNNKNKINNSDIGKINVIKNYLIDWNILHNFNNNNCNENCNDINNCKVEENNLDNLIEIFQLGNYLFFKNKLNESKNNYNKIILNNLITNKEIYFKSYFNKLTINFIENNLTEMEFCNFEKSFFINFNKNCNDNNCNENFNNFFKNNFTKMEQKDIIIGLLNFYLKLKKFKSFFNCWKFYFKEINFFLILKLILKYFLNEYLFSNKMIKLFGILFLFSFICLQFLQHSFTPKITSLQNNNLQNSLQTNNCINSLITKKTENKTTPFIPISYLSNPFTTTKTINNTITKELSTNQEEEDQLFEKEISNSGDTFIPITSIQQLENKLIQQESGFNKKKKENEMESDFQKNGLFGQMVQLESFRKSTLFNDIQHLQ
ncbi:hypothetical protein ABK040_008753 [Willaertia magna]